MAKDPISKKQKWTKGVYYEPIIKRSKYWPVVQLSKNRKAFVEEVVEETLNHIHQLRPTRKERIEEIEGAHYRENLRMRANPWRVDPKDEKRFWDNIKEQLINLTGDADDGDEDEILRKIIEENINIII